MSTLADIADSGDEVADIGDGPVQVCQTEEGQGHGGLFAKLPGSIASHGWSHKSRCAQLVVHVTRLERVARRALQLVPGKRIDVLERRPLPVLLERLVDELQEPKLWPRELD